MRGAPKGASASGSDKAEPLLGARVPEDQRGNSKPGGQRVKVPDCLGSRLSCGVLYIGAVN